MDEFILKIENRYFNYTNIREFFRNMEKEELNKNLLALEKYHKRQKNITKSLRGLIEYTEKMDKIYQIRTLTWGLSLYPELYQLGIFQDIISSEINLQYGQVKEFIQTTERDRDILLKYAYNIHTYQNKIESIYNENLYNLYRFKNDKLLELILSDTNLNRNLQVKDSFENFANLHNDDFCKYLENLERNQLKRIVIILIQLYFNEKQYEIDYYKRSSEELTRIELTMSLDNNDMLSEAIDFITTTSFEIQKTSDFFKKNQNLLETYVYKHFGYYNNIMDFLRSTNIYYLKLWLRKYELIIRRKKMYTNIKGGLENNFLNEYTKKDILEIFDVYLEEYPELFVPKEFIDIVGLNTDNTPHKKLVELFNDIDQHKQEIIMRIIYSLTGYYQRKNIQTSFNIEEFINEIKNNLFSNDTKIDKDYNNRYLFQLFRFINIFPELNNNKLFENLCINNETRVINLYEDHSLRLYVRRDIVKIAKNVQYYLNYTKGYDKKIINEINEEELKKYIIDFYDDSSLYDKNDLKSRIFDGDFYPIIYDYYENYLNNLDDEHFNFIFYNIKKKCEENYPCHNISNSTTLDEKKKEIVNDIKNVEEFQNPKFFDTFFDFIPENHQDPIYEFLTNSTFKDLKLYTILANIIKIETYEKNKNIKFDNLPQDIYFKINFMSKNEMIKNIIKIKEINDKMISSDMLLILIKHYMLDIGSDNIYDLALY